MNDQLVKGTDVINTRDKKNKEHKSTESWREFLEHTPDLITRWNGNIELVYANTAFEKRIGLSLDVLKNKHIKEINLPEFCTDSFMDKLQGVFESGNTEDHFHTFSGTNETIHLHSSIIPEFNKSGSVHSVLAIASDITKLKNAEEELKEKKELVDAVLNAPNIGITVLKSERNMAGEIIDFKFTLVSKKTEEIFGRTDLAGKSLLQEFPAKKALLTRMRNVVETGKMDGYELYNSGDLSKTWIYFSNAKLSDGLIQLCEDITERKVDEQALGKQFEQHDKENKEKIRDLNHSLSSNNRMLESLNSELQTIGSIAANDYKETLRNLYTSMEFIITNDARNLSDAGKANIRRAQAAIQKMKLLTDDIIAYSSIQLSERAQASVNLNEIIRRVTNEMGRKIEDANAKIEVDEMPVIEGDPPSISLLFSHLIDNAVKFRNEHVSPIIRIVYSKTGGMYINHADADPSAWYNVISVIDNGIGFEEQHSKKIFGIFQRLHERNKYKGSGIGLALCKKIMNMHDGFITAESIPHTGSTFNCFFPVKP